MLRSGIALTHWIAWWLSVAALHFVWEMTQGAWYEGMNELPFARALALCSRATVGDVIITAIAFMAAAALTRSRQWPFGEKAVSGSAAFLATGLAITIAYEIYALSTGRWTYGHRMPLILGLGLLPLLQWILLPPIEIALLRLIWLRGDHRMMRR